MYLLLLVVSEAEEVQTEVLAENSEFIQVEIKIEIENEQSPPFFASTSRNGGCQPRKRRNQRVSCRGSGDLPHTPMMVLQLTLVSFPQFFMASFHS